MEKEKMKNSEALNLYDVFKENYEIGKRTGELNEKCDILGSELFHYGSSYLDYQRDFAEVESILGLRKNLELFFYKFLPFLIQEKLRENQTKIDSLDASEFGIFYRLYLYFWEKESKTIYCDYSKTEYFLPSNHDDSNFDLLLKQFIIQYNIGKVAIHSKEPLTYHIVIDTNLKDLIYACYVGQEWVKALEDDCVDLLSDYYNKEQLESFKRTLHK